MMFNILTTFITEKEITDSSKHTNHCLHKYKSYNSELIVLNIEIYFVYVRCLYRSQYKTWEGPWIKHKLR